jgi:hypothetical protein
VSIGESHPLLGESIDVGSIDLATLQIVASYIPVPQVVGIQQDDIGSGFGSLWSSLINGSLLDLTRSPKWCNVERIPKIPIGLEFANFLGHLAG